MFPLTWRPMTGVDIDGVCAVAAEAFPDHREDRACFEDRLTVYPQGCFVLEDDRGVHGYLIAYPWRLDGAPALNSRLDALPDGADVLYLHDLALSARVRGQGQAGAAVAVLVDHARAAGWNRLTLTAVNDAADFWRRQGFQVRDSQAMREKLTSYGPEARYMTRDLD